MDIAMIVVLVVVIGGGALMMFALLFGVFGLPMVYGKRIASWTEGKSTVDAWTAIEQGGTRSFFQVFPASYLVEEQVQSFRPPPQAWEYATALFSSGWGRKVLHRDQHGLVVSYRFLPFLGTDLGWIGVLLVQPNGPGSIISTRFRTTYMWPVFTFFLKIRLKMYVLRRLAL